jgi:chromate transporter
MTVRAREAPEADAAVVPFGEAFRFWLLLGFVNFGGPAGQIATMHHELVERRRWISESAYLRALNFCTLLPGPEATQLATYIGWRLHGIKGGLVAGAFFVIPSIFVLLGLSWLSVAHADVPAIAGLFYGIQAAVIAIVVEAVVRIGKRALKHRALYAFAATAFIALYVFSIPFPLVILVAGLAGLLLQRRWPQVFQAQAHGGQQGEAPRAADERAEASYPPLTRAVKFLAVFVVLWALPVGALLAWKGGSHVLVQEALFFTRAAFITFGGAYAVLSYIAQQAVEHYHWLDTDKMVQGLGLAETTPGPLIMVTQYVGFVGAWNQGGEPRLLYAVLGALVTTYVTFLPCFLFIFVGAPYIEALANNRRLQAALVAITAAVVGVILNLAVFFARHVLFPGDRLDGFALIVAVVAFLLAWRYHVPIHYLVLIGAVAGMLWTLAT